MANAKRVTRKTSSKIMRPPMTKKKLPELAVESTGKDLYLVYDGIRIAKRGELGTPEEETWIYLEPGYEVFEGEGFSAIVIDKFEPPTQ